MQPINEVFVWLYSLTFGVMCAIATLATGVNGSAWRFTSLPELVGLLRACVGAALLLTLLVFFFNRGTALPRSVPFLAATFSFVMMGGVRVAYRMSRERIGTAKRWMRGQSTPIKNIALYGASNNADIYIRSLRRSTDVRVNVLGMFDDRPRWHGSTLQGVRVLGGIEMLPDVQDHWRIDGCPVSELVITEPHLKPQEIRAIVTKAAEARIPTRCLTDLDELTDVDAHRLVSPRPIRIEQLLGRREVPLDTQLLGAFVMGKTVLVSGAGGSIGAEICRQVASLGAERIICVEHSEFALYSITQDLVEVFPEERVVACLADIRDDARIDEIFERYAPDIVFHAAALKHVPLMEVNRVECLRTNVVGTRVVADAADRHGVAAFVMISSDKAVSPTSIMGASKRAAEAYCQAKDRASETTRYLTVRFGNVVDSNGSVLPLFRKQLQRGGPLTVTHPDIKRYFMTIPEAVRLVFKASMFGAEHPDLRGCVYVLDMGEPIRIYEIAERMIELAGYAPGRDVDIEIVGLRQGEKLKEELFAPNEPKVDTGQEGFFAAAPQVAEYALMAKLFDEMDRQLDERNADAALKQLRHLVPDYLPADPVHLKQTRQGPGSEKVV
ncbi:MAG: nucleoside-diphosphate sugar epimerase/dehydratase [Pseudomonadota bacterium]